MIELDYHTNLTVISSNLQPSVYLTKKPDLIQGIPDGVLALISPVILYWSYCTFFHIIDVYHLAEKYRIHPSEEELAKNKASLKDVIYDVVLQHIIQTIVGYGVYCLDPTPTTGFELKEMWELKQKLHFLPNEVIYLIYMYGIPLLRIIIAFAIIDTWQYTLHRYMHMNRWMYNRFHSRHHRLQVPYAYGALYNDPVEGFLLDTCGTGLSAIIMGLTARESLFLYSFSTMKTIDDHCGYRFPYDPFQMIFPNNSVYHDIHHQSWGFKHNFSQPFFTWWDTALGTKYKFVNEYKDLQDKVTLERYKKFLNDRTIKKNK
ncbi:sphingolipid C4-hydroxylase Sur2p [[Candida] jaroonii]|uniref:Sphingolipid C4-hydroxylase Sur2p n=1 Tax=[Candida] jaroonii TaxID=467808 RepID=A0ACA9Y8F3_9ASCO|nr:sphingolipid C4-hydroxylase Sur2p [[Candida] jaroonii]